MSAIAVPVQKPLCGCEPTLQLRPLDLAHMLNSKHPSFEIVVYLGVAYPRIVSRAELRKATGHAGKEPRHSAVFEWLILRANDTLPLTGWKIDEDRERYRLAKISQKHHERLLEQRR